MQNENLLNTITINIDELHVDPYANSLSDIGDIVNLIKRYYQNEEHNKRLFEFFHIWLKINGFSLYIIFESLIRCKTETLNTIINFFIQNKIMFYYSAISELNQVELSVKEIVESAYKSEVDNLEKTKIDYKTLLQYHDCTNPIYIELKNIYEKLIIKSSKIISYLGILKEKIFILENNTNNYLDLDINTLNEQIISI